VIHIEKVKLKETRGWSKPGIIDHFLSEYDEERFHLGFLNRHCNLLWPTLKSQLKEHNIQVGVKYGTIGATINQCLNDTESFFEIGDYDIVHCLDKDVAINLLSNCNVIVHDYSEGASYPTSDFYTWLKELNIVPHNLFLHSSGFNFTKTDLKNVTVLPCSSMFAIYTILQSDIYNILFDADAKKDYVNFLRSQRNQNKFKYLSMIYNRKPRHSRINLLSNLFDKKILDECLWTLAWKNTSSNTDWNSNNTVLRHQYFLDEGLSNNSADKKIKNFLKHYKNILPKNYSGLEAIDPASGTRFLKDWAGLSKWNSVVEVYTVADHPNHINPQGFLTEKTFRSYLLGMPCLLIAAPGANNELKNLGLPVFDVIDETETNWNRIDQLANFLLEDFNKPKDISNYTEELLYSFDEFWSLDSLCKIISKPLSNLKPLAS